MIQYFLIGWILYFLSAPSWVWVIFGIGVAFKLVVSALKTLAEL